MVLFNFVIQYLIYIRRSNEKGKGENVSLQQQYIKIRQYLLNLGYELPIFDEVETMDKEILRKYGIFLENKSAFTADKRGEFKGLIEAVAVYKNIPIVTWKASRLSRNKKETDQILHLFEKFQDLKIFTTDGKEYTSNIEDLKQLEIDLLEAKSESRQKSRDGKFNMDSTITIRYRFPEKLPYGLEHSSDRYEKGIVIIDEEKAKLVYEIYIRWNSGRYTSKDELGKELTNEGFRNITYRRGINGERIKEQKPVTEKFIEKILLYSLYGGIYIKTYTEVTREEREHLLKSKGKVLSSGRSITIDYSEFLGKIKGYYPILAGGPNGDLESAKKIWFAAQTIKKGKRRYYKNPVEGAEKLFFTYKIPQIVCAFCGSPITAEKKRNRRDTYRCTCENPEKCLGGVRKYASEAKIEKILYFEIISKLKFSNPEQIEAVKTGLKNALIKMGKYKDDNTSVKTDEIKQLKTTLSGVQKKLNDPDLCTLDVASFSMMINHLNTQKSRLLNEIEKIRNEIEGMIQETGNYSELGDSLAEYLGILTNAANHFEKLSPKARSVIIRHTLEKASFDGADKKNPLKELVPKRILRIFVNGNVRGVHHNSNRETSHSSNIQKPALKSHHPLGDGSDLPYGDATESGTPLYGMKTRCPNR